MTNRTRWDDGDPHGPGGFTAWGEAISDDVDEFASGRLGVPITDYGAIPNGVWERERFSWTNGSATVTANTATFLPSHEGGTIALGHTNPAFRNVVTVVSDTEITVDSNLTATVTDGDGCVGTDAAPALQAALDAAHASGFAAADIVIPSGTFLFFTGVDKNFTASPRTTTVTIKGAGYGSQVLWCPSTPNREPAEWHIANLRALTVDGITFVHTLNSRARRYIRAGSTERTVVRGCLFFQPHVQFDGILAQEFLKVEDTYVFGVQMSTADGAFLFRTVSARLVVKNFQAFDHGVYQDKGLAGGGGRGWFAATRATAFYDAMTGSYVYMENVHTDEGCRSQVVVDGLADAGSVPVEHVVIRNCRHNNPGLPDPDVAGFDISNAEHVQLDNVAVRGFSESFMAKSVELADVNHAIIRSSDLTHALAERLAITGVGHLELHDVDYVTMEGSPDLLTVTTAGKYDDGSGPLIEANGTIFRLGVAEDGSLTTTEVV